MFPILLYASPVISEIRMLLLPFSVKSMTSASVGENINQQQSALHYEVSLSGDLRQF